jgi:hypothetical protein
MNKVLGQIITCAHCKGAGKCDCYYCSPVNPPFEPRLSMCMTCAGIGSMWVGPQSVTLVLNNMDDISELQSKLQT